jgi:predicted nucleic acid-binding protein
MTSYIVDASVIAQWLVTEPYTSNVIAILQQVQSPDYLAVPEFCRIECVNILWKRVRFFAMPQSVAERQLLNLVGLPLRVVSTDLLYPEALRIGIHYNLAIYDSVYIALAKHLNYPLVTVDQKQSTAALQENVTLKPITDFVQ